MEFNDIRGREGLLGIITFPQLENLWLKGNPLVQDRDGIKQFMVDIKRNDKIKIMDIAIPTSVKKKRFIGYDPNVRAFMIKYKVPDFIFKSPRKLTDKEIKSFLENSESDLTYSGQQVLTTTTTSNTFFLTGTNIKEEQNPELPPNNTHNPVKQISETIKLPPKIQSTVRMLRHALNNPIYLWRQLDRGFCEINRGIKDFDYRPANYEQLEQSVNNLENALEKIEKEYMEAKKNSKAIELECMKFLNKKP